MVRGHFSGFKRPRNDSGVMFADGIHFADLFNFILGALPKRVLAIHHDFMGRGMDDVSFVSLEYDTPYGDTWGTVETNYFMPGKFREVIVCGDKLSAVCDYNVAQYKIKTYENQHVRTGRISRALKVRYTRSNVRRKSRCWPSCARFWIRCRRARRLSPTVGPVTMRSA